MSDHYMEKQYMENIIIDMIKIIDIIDMIDIIDFVKGDCL